MIKLGDWAFPNRGLSHRAVREIAPSRGIRHTIWTERASQFEGGPSRELT